MRRLILTTFTLFIITITAWADVKVDTKNHIHNTKDGLCTWCATETMALTLGWLEAKGLTAGKDKPGHHHDALAELDRLKIKYRSNQATGSDWWYLVWYKAKNGTPVVLGTVRDETEALKIIKNSTKEGDYWFEKRYYWKTDFVWKAVADGLGAVVSVDFPYYNTQNQRWEYSRHMVYVVGMDSQTCRIIDSNYEAGKIRTEPLHIFMQHFNGFAIVIEKKP